MNNKETKTALITGANRGIGYAISQGLLKADFQVSSDMGGENASRTTEQGADTAVWLATIDSVKDSGKLGRDRSVVLF